MTPRSLVDVALITQQRFEAPTGTEPLAANVLEEDRLVVAALARHGLTSQRVDWARPEVDWSRFRCALFRTPWDYFERPREFSAWLARIDGQLPCFNPLPLVRWNFDKHYLADLERRGTRIVPTRFVERGQHTALAGLLAGAGWDEVVIKPAVSGAARHTHRVSAASAGAMEPLWQELVAERAMLVQPFQREIVARGELTLVLVDGGYSHAVRKVARVGDFRVQDDHGGTVHPYQPSSEEIAFAEQAVRAAGFGELLYGRVDMVRDNEGALAVMELELFEPELWLRCQPAAAQRLAAGLRRRLDAAARR